MLKRTTYLLIFLSNYFMACSNMPFGKDSTLEKQEKIISIDGEDISKENFVYLYEKNYDNDSTYYSKENVNSYLDLFINFKLKVAEALRLKYDTLPGFKSEYKMYLHQLEEPYLTETIFNDSLVKQAYDRQKIEVNASHILISVKEGASPEDTLKAYNKIIEIKKEALAGKDFGELAIQNSTDPSAKQNKGNLGYFSSLQMVYPFEEAAFNTPIDSISAPVKTKFGYHILQVHDKRERFGTLQVQHIMINSTPRETKEAQEIAQAKAFSIYDSLKNGGNWDELCTSFSQDKRSAANQGILPPVSEVRFPPQFMNGVNSLREIGEVAEPIKTDFGWHIIKLYKKEPVAPYDEMYPSLVKKVKRDSRSQTSRADFIKKLQHDNAYTINGENKALAFSLFDSTYLENEWKKTEELSIKILKKDIFTLKTKKVSINDFLDYCLTQQKVVNKDLNKVLENHFKKFSEITLLDEEKKNLSNKYPEYKHLAQEYKDGLLLFRVMEDCVWNKASQDPEGLKNYYNSNSNDYMWDNRAKLVVYNTGSKKLLHETIDMLDSGYYQVYPSDISVINYKRNSSYLYKSKVKDIRASADALKADSTLFVVLNVEYNPKENKTLRTKRLNNIKEQFIASGINQKRIKSNFEEGMSGVVDLKYFSTNTSNYVNQKNSDNNLSISYFEGTYNNDNLPFADVLKMEKGRYIIEENNRFIVVDINEILPPAVKRLEECKGNVIADYQEYIEKEWIEELHQTHEVIIDSMQLNSLYKADQSI